MNDVMVTPTTLYGRTRLHVSLGRRRIGWADVRTGQTVVEDPAHTEAVHAAVDGWLAQHDATHHRAPA